MKLSSILRGTYVAMAALALTTAAAFATVSPIQGIPVGLEHDPGSEIIAHGVTDGKGQVSFGNLAPGKYLIVIDGRGLGAALKKIDPKGLPHTIRVVFGLPGQKPIVSSDLPYNGGDAANLSVRVAVGDVNGDSADAKKHNYIGTVTLVK
jgi:hypothetical protein